jgi:NAD(P)-dependent dehydrogenase (short-subunit alcohol dehydrogenase family)
MSPNPSPSFDLSGKAALVTGAGRGLGLASAQALAHSGAAVTLAARSENEVADAADALRQDGLDARHLVMDVTDTQHTAALIAAAGPFNILVNNAGTNIPAAFLDVTPTDFDAILSLNVRAAFLVAQAVARGLVAAGQPGSIINMSSQMGHVGSPRRSVYCASKHAMEGFTKVTAMELGAHGIRVNTICPTFIETPLTRPFFENEDFRSGVLAKIRTGRIGQVEDVTGAVIYLASDASSLVTGSALKVDGGWTAG